MTNEVFISYSHHDKLIADGVCANLESAGIRCWIAPRDIAPGHDWPTAISEAIKHSRVMVLIFSSRSNASKDVGRELILASNSNCIIVPFKIENVEPEPGKEYYLARTHWLDAMDPPTQEQVDKLVKCVHALLVEAGVELAHIPPVIRLPVTEVVQPPASITPGELQLPPTQIQEVGVLHQVEKTTTSRPAKPAQIPASTAPQLPVKKPRSRRWIGFGFGFGIFVLAIGVFLILQNFYDIPALSAIFSHPTPTSTTTRAPSPTIRPTITTEPSPTETPLPSWVSEFAQPILTAIATREYDFDAQEIVDYRDWLNADCTPPNISMGDSTFGFFASDCRFSWKSWFTDFVIKMNVRMEPVDSREPDSGWTFSYRSFDGFSFFYDGRVKSAMGDFEDPDALWPGLDNNQIIIIVKDQETALIINDQPIYYGTLPSGFKNGIGYWSVNDPVTFQDMRIWNINDLP